MHDDKSHRKWDNTSGCMCSCNTDLISKHSRSPAVTDNAPRALPGGRIPWEMASTRLQHMMLKSHQPVRDTRALKFTYWPGWCATPLSHLVWEVVHPAFASQWLLVMLPDPTSIYYPPLYCWHLAKAWGSTRFERMRGLGAPAYERQPTHDSIILATGCCARWRLHVTWSTTSSSFTLHTFSAIVIRFIYLGTHSLMGGLASPSYF